MFFFIYVPHVVCFLLDVPRMVPLCMSSLHMWKLIRRASDSEQCDYRGLDANEEGKTVRMTLPFLP